MMLVFYQIPPASASGSKWAGGLGLGTERDGPLSGAAGCAGLAPEANLKIAERGEDAQAARFKAGAPLPEARASHMTGTIGTALRRGPLVQHASAPPRLVMPRQSTQVISNNYNFYALICAAGFGIIFGIDVGGYSA